VLAAYNGGSGNVRKWLNDSRYSRDGKTLDKIPFNETKNFVDRVWHAYERYKKLYSL
jgi:soluble lytic murein transglycosylase